MGNFHGDLQSLPSLCRRKIHEDSNVRDFLVPSGKLLHNYGQSPFLMGKLTISMAIFNSFLYVYQRVDCWDWWMNPQDHPCVKCVKSWESTYPQVSDMPTESWWLGKSTPATLKFQEQKIKLFDMIFEQHHPLNLMFGLHDLWLPQLSQEVKCELRTWDNSERTWAVLKTHVWSIMVDYYMLNIYIYTYMELYSPIYQGHPLIYQPERFRLTSVTEVTIVLDRGVKSDSLSMKPAMPGVGRCWLGWGVIFSHHV